VILEGAVPTTVLRPAGEGSRPSGSTKHGDDARSGPAVTHLGNESLVRVGGGCDAAMAWLVRDCLDDVVAAGHRRVTLDVSALRFADFTAVAILVGALARIRQLGAEVAVCPPSSGAYQVLKRATLTTARAVDAR
jgi:anti-anti-sigma factor